ncbi:hypothetical protein MRX96_019211 [Rhipicephalus microplus]
MPKCARRSSLQSYKSDYRANERHLLLLLRETRTAPSLSRTALSGGAHSLYFVKIREDRANGAGVYTCAVARSRLGRRRLQERHGSAVSRRQARRAEDQLGRLATLMERRRIKARAGPADHASASTAHFRS